MLHSAITRMLDIADGQWELGSIDKADSKIG